MIEAKCSRIGADVLTGSMFDFARPAGRDLLERTCDFEVWRHARLQAGVWPFSRVLHGPPSPEMRIADESGRIVHGTSRTISA